MFFKKKDKTKSIIARIVHYEGLPNIPQEFSCHVSIEGSDLHIKQPQQGIDATLSINKIQMTEILQENDFMIRYKHTYVPTTNKSPFVKLYWVIKYIDGSGEICNIVFWSVPPDSDRVRKLWQQLQNLTPKESVTL